MNEKEIEQIREFTQLHYLIKEAVTALDDLKNSRIALKGLLSKETKHFGAWMRSKQQGIQKELRAAGTNVSIVDEGGELICVHVTRKGVNDYSYIKRGIMQEDVEARLDTLLKELEDSQVYTPYKVEPFKGDPYRNLHAKK